MDRQFGAPAADPEEAMQTEPRPREVVGNSLLGFIFY